MHDWDRSTVAANEARVRTRFWPKLAQALSRIPFADKAVAAYYCAIDPSTPLKARGTLLAALAYFILPIDALPDFILGLGFTDDMAVLVTAFTLIRNHIKPEHFDRARETVERLRRADGI